MTCSENHSQSKNKNKKKKNQSSNWPKCLLWKNNHVTWPVIHSNILNSDLLKPRKKSTDIMGWAEGG